MRIPTSYDQITLRQLIEVQKILSKKLKDYDENIALAAYFTSRSQDYIECLPYSKSVLLIDRVRKLKASKPDERIKKVVWIKGKPYKSITDIEKFSKKRAERFIRLTDLHQRAALLYKPYFSSNKLTSQGNYRNQDHHEWEALAEQLLDQKVNDVYGAVFFYARVWIRLCPVIEAYLLSASLITNHLTNNLAPDQNGSTSQVSTAGIGQLT